MTLSLSGRCVAGALLLCLLTGCAQAKPAARPTAVPAATAATDLTPRFPQGTRILFQGDSITDGGRGYGDDPNHILGQDYAYLIAARCGAHFPDMGWTFINRGISGNKVTDLAGRWQNDALNLKPDILSVLVGVNDAASVVGSGGKGGVSAAQYEQVYDGILQQSLAANPNLKIVLCESFVAQTGHVLENPALWNAEIKKRQDVVERLAAKYHAPVVHFQPMFDAAIAHSSQPVTYWIWDGIHPTYAGHELMAEEWLRTVNQFYYSGKTPPRPTVAAAAPSPAAPAATTKRQGALSFGTSQASNNTSVIVLGWTFQTGASPVSVTSLGYLNDGATGAAATHTVGLYDGTTKALLAPGVTVTTSGGDLTGTNATFSYVKLGQPVVLSPHTAYAIVATASGTGWLQAPSQVATAYGLDIHSLHCAFHFGSSTLVFPDQTYGQNDPALLGPNFLAASAATP